MTERLEQRTEVIEQTVEAVRNINWQQHIQLTANLPDGEVLQQQGEQLLRCLYKGKNFQECLTELLAGDIPTLQHLVRRLPELRATLEREHQPSLAALLAYKDSMRIPDAKWG